MATVRIVNGSNGVVVVTTEHEQTVQANLIKLGETDLTVSDPAKDVRGRKVFDRDGEELGKVSGLMIDDREHKVRFLEVSGGGFLGIGDHTVLIPVDAISRIDDEHVHVNQTREHVAGGPKYDPELAKDPTSWLGYYGYYEVLPFWTPGYIYPGYPGFP
jgi:sporulation protein YlmC with PRC-barrel domain